MDEFLACIRERIDVDDLLIQISEFCVERPQLFEESICRKALPDKLVVKLELSGGGVACAASLCNHGGRRGFGRRRLKRVLTTRVVYPCCPLYYVIYLLQLASAFGERLCSFPLVFVAYMPPSTLPVPAKRALPPKESTLFRELLTLYETRQLKKALKTADQILKKYPEHGGRQNLIVCIV